MTSGTEANSTPAWREAVAVAGGYVCLAILATWPLATRMGSALPSNLGDPLLNTFILAWDADRMLDGFKGFWSAPFFYPLTDTLARSEHLIGIAIFTAPIQWLGGNAVLAHNVAFLGSYVLAGCGMYLLARGLWGRRDAAILAGVAFALAPYRLPHCSHLQVMMSGWMPICLWGLHRFFTTGSKRAITVFAAAFALQGLSNGYLLYFFGAAVLVVIAAECAGRLRAARAGSDAGRPSWRRVLLGLSAAALGIAIAMAPIGAAYIRLRRSTGFARRADEIVTYGARLADYLTTTWQSSVWGHVLPLGAPEHSLFPGFIIVALAVCGIATLWVNARDGLSGDVPPRWRALVLTYLVVLLVAFWLSQGARPWTPYAWLFRVVPGFNGLRVPARFVLVVSVALAVLGSAGAAFILGRLRRPAIRAIAWALLTAAIAVEGWGAPIELAAFDVTQPERQELDQWLKASPRGAVVELPISGPLLAPFTLPYQFATLRHRHPIVNGFTGTGSDLQDFLGGAASPFNNPSLVSDALRGLSAIGVRYVVDHRDLYERRPNGDPPDSPLVAAIDASTGEILARRQWGAIVAWMLAALPQAPSVDESALVPVDLHACDVTASPMPERAHDMIDGRIESRWLNGAPQTGREWIRIDCGRPFDAARIRIETPPAANGDYPRHLVVESGDGSGRKDTLWEGAVVSRLIEGMVRDGMRAPISIDLPANRTRQLFLRQTATTSSWRWAVHELRVWERPHASP